MEQIYIGDTGVRYYYNPIIITIVSKSFEKNSGIVSIKGEIYIMVLVFKGASPSQARISYPLRYE